MFFFLIKKYFFYYLLFINDKFEMIFFIQISDQSFRSEELLDMNGL